MYITAGFVYVRDTYFHHMCLSHDIHMVTICTYVMILTSVIFGHKLQTIDQNIYFFLKNYNDVHFAYQLLWVYMAHEEIISETLKNYVTSSNNFNKTNLYG